MGTPMESIKETMMPNLVVLNKIGIFHLLNNKTYNSEEH
jgi:hypothetical protein